MRIDISELSERFPDFRVATVLCDGLEVEARRSEELHDLIAEREEEARRHWAGVDLAEIPGIRVWRRAYREFGIKRTSYRSSVERLLKNCLAERALPSINSFVDIYNTVSLTHVLPLGADDVAFVEGDIAYRYARAGDTFLDMANGGEAADNPPKDGEVVLADDAKVLCRRWNWRQDARSLISCGTARALVVIEDNGRGGLDAAVADFRDLVGYFCKGRAAVTVATAEDPIRELSWP